MNTVTRIAHLGELLRGHKALRQHILEHRNTLLGHERSRERDRALLHCVSGLRRADKLEVRLERALFKANKRANTA